MMRQSRGSPDSWLLESRLRNALGAHGTIRTKYARATLSRDTVLSFRCRLRRHEFTLSVAQILDDEWCPRCLEARLSRLRVIARRANLTVAAPRPLRRSMQVTLRCKKGHERDTRLVIHRALSCHTCRSELRESIRAVSRRQGGGIRVFSLITTTFACASHHEFKLKNEAVLSGSWCPECVQDSVISEINAHIARRKGKRECIYVASRDAPAAMSCSRGHRFLRRLRELEAGLWCPRCEASESKG